MASVTVTFEIAFLERELADPVPWTGSVQLLGEGIRGTDETEIPFSWQEPRFLELGGRRVVIFQNVDSFTVAPASTPFQRELNGRMRQLNLDVSHNEIPSPFGGGPIRIDLEDRITARVLIERGDTVVFGLSEPVTEFFENRRNRRIVGGT